MSWTSFEPEDSASGRRIYILLPEDEPSGSKRVEDVKKNKKNNLEKVPFLVYIV